MWVECSDAQLGGVVRTAYSAAVPCCSAVLQCRAAVPCCSAVLWCSAVVQCCGGGAALYCGRGAALRCGAAVQHCIVLSTANECLLDGGARTGNGCQG